MTEEWSDEEFAEFLDWNIRVLYKEKFDDADNDCPGEQLLKAIWYCFANNVDPPAWIKDAYMDSLDNYFWLSGDADSNTPLVSAFKTDPKAGLHRKSKRAKKNLTVKIRLAVEQKHKEGLPIDDNLFDEIGEELKIKGSTAKNYYYKYQ